MVYVSQCDCIVCLENPGSTENGLLRYMMAMEDARQRDETNRGISIVKLRRDCPTRLDHFIIDNDLRH